MGDVVSIHSEQERRIARAFCDAVDSGFIVLKTPIGLAAETLADVCKYAQRGDFFAAGHDLHLACQIDFGHASAEDIAAGVRCGALVEALKVGDLSAASGSRPAE
jgi:hypothetical protein